MNCYINVKNDESGDIIRDLHVIITELRYVLHGEYFGRFLEYESIISHL